MPSAAGEDAWFREPSAFLNVHKTRGLAGVQCENCHGPGSRHIEDPISNPLFVGKDDPEAWKARCMTCHDADNSPAFMQHGEWYTQMVNHHNVPSDTRTVLPGGRAGGRRGR